MGAERGLARADLRTSPRSFKLHRLIAMTMFDADTAHATIDRIVEEIETSLTILDSLPDLRNSPETYRAAGAVYLAKGDRLQASGTGNAEAAYRSARAVLEKCIQITKASALQREAAHGKRPPGVGSRTEPEAYRLLSMVQQRLGDMSGALRTAREAQAMAPWDPMMYGQIGDLLLMRQQGDEAAVAFIEGMLITSDPSLQADLVGLYSSSTAPANCTLVPGPQGPSINPQCPIVRAHMCAAAPHVLTALVGMGRRQEALENKQIFLSDFHCEPGPLIKALP